MTMVKGSINSLSSQIGYDVRTNQTGVQAVTVLQPQGAVPKEDNKGKDGKVDKVKLDDAVEKINKTTQIFNKKLHFKIHEETKRWMVQIIDTNNGKVLREIPPKEVLDLVARLDDMVGLLVDNRV